MTGSNNRIAIENCRRLHIRRDTFSEIVFVNQIRFENINELTLESFAINYSKGTLKIIFDNVSSYGLIVVCAVCLCLNL